MSGKQPAQQKPAPKKEGDKKKRMKRKVKWDPFRDIQKAYAEERRERLIRKINDPAGYEKQKRINMQAHQKRQYLIKMQRQYLRITRNPHLFKDGHKIKRVKEQSVWPHAAGKMSGKVRQMFVESLPLQALSRKTGARHGPSVLHGAKRFRSTREWIEDERNRAKRVEMIAKKRSTRIAAQRKERKAKKEGKKPADAAVPVPKEEKKKETDKVAVKQVQKTRPHVGHKPLRKSLTPGTIVITLVPPALGRRVVFLKQLPSGAILCAGPAKLNRAPLHRLNPKHVIATSTKIDISSVKLGKIKEKEIFGQRRHKRTRANAKSFFGDKKEEKKEEKKDEKKVKNIRPLFAATKAIDRQLIPLIRKVPHLAKYLSKRFTLGRFSHPHLMKF